MTKNSALAIVLAVTGGLALMGCSGNGLSDSAALERLRADKDLPIPAEDVKVVGITEGETERIVKVDFGGTIANVKFRRFDKGWSPEQMETAAGGWVDLATGFSMMTEGEQRAAISYLESLVSGQFAYSAACGEGWYAPSLAALTTAPPGASVAFVSDDLKPAPGDAHVDKAHYRIEVVTAPSPKAPASCNGLKPGLGGETWSATAVRKKGYPGNSYKVDTLGRVSIIP